MHIPTQPVRQDVLVRQDKSNYLYKVYFFGPFRVMRGNQPLGELVWRRNKAKALLKWFLLNPGRMFSADQLVKTFWPGIVRSAGLRNLHVTMNYLRHTLEPDLPARQESTFVRRNKDNFYWFALDEMWWADVLDFHDHYTAAKEAHQHQDLTAVVYHYRTIARYCGLGFLPEDTYEDTFTPYRRQYERIYGQVLEDLIHLCCQLKMFDEAFTYSQQALSVDPYCESAVKAIINVYLQQGNISGAIRKLGDFQSLLWEDLGIEPGEDILTLRKNISSLLSTRIVAAQ